jgi:hypothetical protein
MEMANPEHEKVVRQGAAAIAEWQRRNPVASLDLSGADLRAADLLEANLFEADLAGADLTTAHLAMVNLVLASLSKAQLREADLFAGNLTQANLTGANLRGANLSGANLLLTNLTDAELCEADLRGASLWRANLTEADLTETRLGGTSLGNCDLSPARGLSAVVHEGPSSIGVDTLIASFRGAGNQLTPELKTFFLGAGVPKELLAELPRIVAEVKYYSCFISYGQPDLDFAKKLHDDLVASGVSCWIYDLDKTPGERTWKEISEARRQADRMLVICSLAALIRDGVLKEIEEQIDEDPNKIVPISRDNTWNQPGFAVTRGSRQLKPFVEERNYADFSDDSRYEEPLQRLLKALRRKAD